MDDQPIPNTRPDPHSYFRTDQPRLQHVDWNCGVFFRTHTLHCLALLQFDRSGVVDLDTRDLAILEVASEPEMVRLAYDLAPAEPVIGSRLRVTMPDGVTTIRIVYTTSVNASALQWLTPEQTAGKRHPFLFSQGECIHTRSFLPCQDSPGVRFTYTARLTVPKELRGLMAAQQVKSEEVGDWREEEWRMDHPIPAYLIALAVGELESRDLSPRSRVWAEPALADKAAWECADVEQMIVAAERLFGPYPWGRFDLLFLPPSFPYGGMENPTLVFLTPSLITGDRSAMSVVIHELAHAWTGNLVTNATWSDFWLNEGWTTYAQMRIHEALYGRDGQELQAALLRHELDRDLARFADQPQFTRLWTDLPGTVDPDDTFSRVPYCKGYLFLRVLEEAVGRERFDAFIRTYIARFGFQSITTAMFLDVVAAELPGALVQVHAGDWVYEPGIPDNAPTITSSTRDAIDALVSRAKQDGRGVTGEEAVAWNDTAWTYYLESLPRNARELCEDLETRFRRSRHTPEIQWAWYLLAIESGADFDRARLEEFLAANGRLKYLRPLYTALHKRPETRAWAREVFSRVQGGYHPIAQSTMAKLLAEEPPPAPAGA